LRSTPEGKGVKEVSGLENQRFARRMGQGCKEKIT